MAASVAEWREIGMRPIRPEAPAGVSVRYDSEFELLEAQIQKLEGLSHEPVDWPEIVAVGQRILEQKSKDILLCAYVAMGLLQTEGLAGLTKGLACMESMISTCWPDLFPELKRLKARINALNWLAAKAASAIAQGGFKTAGEAAIECDVQARSLHALIEEKVPTDPPDWAELLRSLQELTVPNSPAPAEHAPDAEQRAKSEAKSLGEYPRASAPIETPEDARRLLSETIEPLKRALTLSRAAEPSASMPYSLIRALIWSEIDSPPPATEGRTLVPPPPIHLQNHCQNLAADSAWRELLDEAEDRIAEFPFWFDLHRMIDQALGNLGKEYKSARNAVRAEVISLLTRLPGLSELQFSDGTPFADDSTQRWIAKDLFPAKPQLAVTAPLSGADAETLADLHEKSRKLLDEGKQAEAINLVQDGIKTSSTERIKFLTHLELAKLCRETGQLKPALARLEILDDEIRRFSLESWEPNLCVEVLQLYWETLNDLARSNRQLLPDTIRQADIVYNRLCNLDVLAGLHVTQALRR